MKRLRGHRPNTRTENYTCFSVIFEQGTLRRNFVWSLKCSIAHLANGVLIISLSQYRRRWRFSICRKTGGTRGARGQAAPCTPRSESGFYSTRFSRSSHLAVFRPSPVANLADTYRGHFRGASGICAWAGNTRRFNFKKKNRLCVSLCPGRQSSPCKSCEDRWP